MLMFSVYLLALTLFCVSNGNISLQNGQHFIDLNDLKKVSLHENTIVDGKWLKRLRRDAGNGNASNPSSHEFYLNGTESNNEAFVHWSGKGKSDAIFVLTRQHSPSTNQVKASTVWRSLDYGITYTPVKFSPETIISYFYVSPVNFKKAIFLDKEKKTLYITEDELTSKTAVTVQFQPDRIMPHPTQENYLLAYSFMPRELYISIDFGKTWKHLHSGVSPRLYWAVPDYGDSNETVHIEMISPNGRTSHYGRCTITSCNDSSVDHKLGSFESNTLLIIKQYIFVEKKDAGKVQMYVSHNRQAFKKAYFPPNISPKDFIIVNADEGQVFIAVSHSEGVTLYLSDSTGQYYVPTLENVLYQPGPGYFAIDLHEVKTLKGTYLANQKVVKGFSVEVITKISFDKGGFWDSVSTPNDEKSKCVNVQNCSLHLQLDMGTLAAPGILSEANAPGLILAQGNVGKTLSPNDIGVYASRNGGLTWKFTGLRGFYRFNILDQGGILTAVLQQSVHGVGTSDVAYSYDQGDSWNTYGFLKSGKKIKVDGVLNEPEINSLAMSVFGHSTATEGWTLVTLNFSTVLPTKCKKDNYEIWLPQEGQQDNCTLGQTLRFERRKQSSVCYNGEDYEIHMSPTSCTCKDEDYECDFGYKQVMIKGHPKCKPDTWFNPSSLIIECTEGEKYNHSIGYRKVASDKCEHEISVYTPELKPCPIVAPSDLRLHSDKDVVATHDRFKIELTQSGGSEKSTMYTWDFGDNSTKVIKGLTESSQVTHSYSQYGKYNITVTAKNHNGTTETSLLIRVEDKVTLLKMDIPWASRVDVSTLFDVILANNYYNQVNHSLFIWTWGDENSANPELSWLKTIHHTYKKVGTYRGSVEAINSVSSVYKSFSIQVFNDTRRVRLSFSNNVDKYDLNNNLVLRVTFFELLNRELVDALGIQDNRYVITINKREPFTVDVVFVPGNANEADIDELSNKLIDEANKKKLVVSLDGRPDSLNAVYITGATLTDDTKKATNDGKSNIRAVYIAVPVFIAALVITILVVVVYKRRFRDVRRYTMLRNRHDEDNQLLGDDDDDDDPPLDLNPEFGTDSNYHDDQLDLGTGSHLVMVTGGRISDDE